MKLSRFKKVTWKLFLVYGMLITGMFFADPDPHKYLRGWFWLGVGLLLSGEAIRVWASGHLVKNKVLTVTGPYAYVKNPLYIGTFICMIACAILAKGDFSQPGYPWYFKYMNCMLLGAGIVLFILYYAPYKKRREGDRLHELFGEAWDHYDRSVPDYFPSLKRYERAESRPWTWAATRANSEHWVFLAIAVGIAFIIYNRAVLDFAFRCHLAVLGLVRKIVS